jgi:sugar phosphate isomerase/epimerase
VDRRIGLNLYSVRELCPDPAALESVLRALHDIGYRYVQISGLGQMEPDQIAAAMSNVGLKCCGTHIPWETFVDDIDEAIAVHRFYGTNHTAIGMLGPEYWTREGADRYVEEARRVIPDLATANMDYSHHNHDHEFIRYGGRTWLDYVYQQASPAGMKFELDTYWVVAGGADPAEYISRFGDSMTIVHLKDMSIAGRGDQRFAPVGSGNLNWPRIFDAIRRTPIEFVIVEQDTHYDDDPIQNVASSFRFLRENGFAQE